MLLKHPQRLKSLGFILPAGLVTGYSVNSCLDVLDHPYFSPDLMLSDFHIFGRLEKDLASEQYPLDTDVKSAAISWLWPLDISLF